MWFLFSFKKIKEIFEDLLIEYGISESRKSRQRERMTSPRKDKIWKKNEKRKFDM